MPTNPQTSIPGSLDQDAVNLAKAIRQTESGGNFQARGKSSEYGAYQFTQPTWEKYSKKHGVNAILEQATPEQQNEVAYKQIKEWKDQGYNPGQIASLWNSGKPDAYLDKNYKGTNKLGVTYDVPKYAESVAKAYHTIKNGGQAGQDPNNPSAVINPNAPDENGYITHVPTSQSTPEQMAQNGKPKEQGLGSQLGERAGQLSSAVSNTVSGQINPLSGIIQGAGAIAGGIGDVVNKGLELIPGVKQVENLIGQGVGYLAKTSAGQSVSKAIGDFSKAHPELADDIGAGFNIVTAIPILKGLGVVSNLAKDAASVALKGIAEKGAIKDITEVVSRTVGGRKALNDIPDAVKTMVKERAIPEIENGRYATKAAYDNLSNKISQIDTAELQPILESVSGKQNFGQSLSTLKKIAIKEASEDIGLKEAGAVPQAIKQIENRFAGWEYSYGKDVDLATQNRLKIGSGKFTDWGTPEHSADKAIYRALQKNIEETATKHGLTEVNAINKKMSKLLETQKVLKYINNKTVKNTGIMHGLIKGVSTIGGEAAGNAVGVPLAGALVGQRTSGLIEKGLSKFSPRSIRTGILKRTAEEAPRQTFKGLVKGTKGLIIGSQLNRANR